MPVREAAAAAARMGARTALVTQSRATIGAMSCNPAIGGLGKGHLVREIDALDGLMGRAADLGGIQFRVLNRRKGPAVQGPRAQADRALYRKAMLGAARSAAEPDDRRSRGVRTGHRRRDASTGSLLPTVARSRTKAVVITTGTFLRGVIHVGPARIPAGRVGNAPSVRLAESLDRIGFDSRRG